MQFNRSQLLKIIGILAGVIVVGLIIYALIPRATITFAVAPEEVTAIINGEERQIKNGESVTVAPGEIVIELRRDEFETTGETFVIANRESREVLIALEPLTENARQLLLNDGSQLVIQRIGGRAVEEGAAQLREQYPILNDLPYNDRFYSIVICNSEREGAEPTDLAVCVRLFEPQARQSALDTIERLGYSLDDYEIIVQDQSFETVRDQAGE